MDDQGAVLPLGTAQAVVDGRTLRSRKNLMNGYLLDLDGTLYVGDEPVPGAVAAIAGLAARGVPHRYVTNTTRMPRRDIAGRLRRMGFAIDAGEILTAPLVAARWLAERGIERIALHVPMAVREDLAGFTVTDDAPEAIVMGDLGDGWTAARLNSVFRQVMDGARLVALHRNRYWRTAEGLMLDAGAFVAAIEYATGEEATVVGKPGADFFAIAAAAMDVEPGNITVIGDDLEADVRGAQRAGMRGVLVRTGKFSEAKLARSDIRPDRVVDSVVEALSGA